MSSKKLSEHKNSFRSNKRPSKSKDKPPDYVNNANLYKALCDYKKSCRKAKRDKLQKPMIPEFVGKCLLLIAQRLSNHPWFMLYSQHWKEEMIADGVENCVTYLDNFDPKKSQSPFAYFTQITYFSFRRRIEKEKKQQYVKLKSLENHLDMNEYLATTQKDGLYENNHEFVRNYENNLTKKRKSTKIRKNKNRQ